MFEFIKRLFGKSSDIQRHTGDTIGTSVPGTQIRYDSALVEHLKTDHQGLLQVYGQMKAAFDEADYKQVSDHLKEFRTNLQGHLLTENLRLYVYLEHMFSHDESNFELIRGFRREMDDIGRVAMNFLKKYETIGVDAELAKPFGEDLAMVGKVLGERIRKEEQVLYPLYAPTY